MLSTFGSDQAITRNLTSPCIQFCGERRLHDFPGRCREYVRQTLETDAGNQNQGVQLALYFQRMAAAITSTHNILADPALLKVVQTVLDISAAMETAGRAWIRCGLAAASPRCPEPLLRVGAVAAAKMTSALASRPT